MKEHGLFIAIIATIFASTTTWIVCSIFYIDKLKYEFKRGIIEGAGYYKKHGEYPSYWHWNNKYENEDFNIDTVIYYNSSFGNVDTILKRHK